VNGINYINFINYSTNVSTSKFIQKLRHPILFRMYLLMKLPAAFFAGVRIRDIDEQHCVTTVPYKWLSQNPFRSTYFACLAMAAEMSSGSLAMAHVSAQSTKVSSLVVKFESSYFKKATGRTRFVCNDGLALRAVIEKAIATSEPQTYTTTATGTNREGEKVAECFITWSLKAKKA
jgi:hypothetical protein